MFPGFLWLACVLLPWVASEPKGHRMTAFRGYDWQLSDAARGYRLTSDDIELDESEKTTIGFKQELLSAIVMAGLALAAYALL